MTEKRRTRNPTTYLAKSFAEFGTRLSLAFGTDGFGHCYQKDRNKRNESTIEREREMSDVLLMEQDEVQ
jgi:hypothetical protein